MTILLANRDPEPNETGVPVDSDVFLEIFETDGSDVDNSNTSVFVNGVLAYLNGTFQAGFTGPNSATSSPATGIRRINIDPTSDFTSEEVVTIRVTSQNAGASNLLDQSYTFTIVDETAPILLSALALARRSILITFDEDVKAVSASNSDDALNPANYVLTPNPAANVPAVTPTVLSVEATAGTVGFELTLDIDLSPDVPYAITVSNVEDVLGNLIVAPGNVAAFVFEMPRPEGRRFDLYRMLPRINRQEDETLDLLRFVRCLQDVTDLALREIDLFPEVFDPDRAPEPFVDAMLCDLGNPFNFSLSLIDKRRLIRVLVDMYREKGTKRGIVNVIRFFLGIEVTVIACTEDGLVLGESELGFDWILGPGEQNLIYSFEVESPIVLTTTQRDRILAIVDYMKPAHTHLKALNEPTAPPAIPDHWELGLSELGDTTLLH